MKILDYNQNDSEIASKRSKRSYERQQKILSSLGLDITTNAEDSYDMIHLSAINIRARRFITKEKRNGIPVVYLANNNAEIFKDTLMLANIISPLYRKFLVSCYQLADRIVVPTEYGKSVLRSYGLEQAIDVIPNPIDLDRFTYDPDKVDQFREYFKLTPTQELVISSGFTYKRKGILDFINVARAMKDVTFIWFGDANHQMLPPVVQKALKNLPENVILAGHIEGNIYEGALQAANVYFYPSHEDLEVQGVQEAMASSCQVVLRDIPVYRPWLVDTESCYMGDSNEDFVTLIRGCLTGKLTGTQQAAYKIAAKQTYEKCGLLLKSTYEKVLEEQK